MTNLYRQEEVEIRIADDLKTGKFKIKKDVRQSYMQSPMFFKIYYLEQIFSETLENEEVGIRVNGK